ncbi:hypothetical protein [Dichotomicrobium thermohalophilum]|uniref:Uncharacterized protein n=1 Tax=Dichotomicrobium thermohalophilum TaxID=933063 RepID=A0A397PJB2_9HYPH|nr:hypothetical protein [Dichotomicrobium thermohalophilum]RIA47257.1 hypothetical protein BXY53_2639 [Dichotomicrobium thermohalophilum]
MIKSDTVALTGALLLFLLFFANVATGAAGKPVFLGDVSEMLVLFASCTLFVIGVLIREARSAR